MCNKVVHLEPEEFIKILQKEQLSVYARVYVLDSGIAGLICVRIRIIFTIWTVLFRHQINRKILIKSASMMCIKICIER